MDVDIPDSASPSGERSGWWTRPRILAVVISALVVIAAGGVVVFVLLMGSRAPENAPPPAVPSQDPIDTPSPIEPSDEPSIPEGEPSDEPVQDMPASGPGALIPVDCDALVPSAVVSQVFAEGNASAGSESTDPFGAALNDQVGFTRCSWHAQGRTLEITLIPDGVKMYKTYSEFVLTEPKLDEYGDASRRACVQTDGGSRMRCEGDLLVGEIWAAVAIDTPKPSYSTGYARLGAVLQSAEVVLREAAATSAPWVPPAVEPLRLPPAVATIRSAFGDSKLAATSVPEGAPRLLAVQRASARSYYWTTRDEAFSVQLALLPGGAWAAARLADAPPAPTGRVGQFAPATVPGADDVLIAPSTQVFAALTTPDTPTEGWIASMSIDGSFVQVISVTTTDPTDSSETRSRENFLASLTKLVAAIR